MTARELERHVVHLLRHHDLARRFRIDSVVQPTDQSEWWIDLTDRTAPHDRREARVVLPKVRDWDRVLSGEWMRAIERIGAKTLSDGAARRCPSCGHTAIFHHQHRRSGASVGNGSRSTAAWRCQNVECDYFEPVSG